MTKSKGYRWKAIATGAMVMALFALTASAGAQTAGGAAQQASTGDADALAKQTQNPVSSLISVPLQGNWDFGLGDRDATGTLLNIQPVMPFGITKSTNVILRVIVPLASQPGADGGRVNGLGDVVTTAFFSPANAGRIIWGVGPVFLLPAATSSALGSEKFGIGPDREDVNATFLQPFANYNLGRGLAVGSLDGSHGQLGGG